MIIENTDPAVKVIQFPKGKRPEPPTGQSLVPIYTRKCAHFTGPYLVDETEAEVTCGECNAKLNPIWVLQRLAVQESNYIRNAEKCRDESKRLAERSRTKCQHCGEMTRISRS